MDKQEHIENITKKEYLPPSVFSYLLNDNNYNKSYDEYLYKFIKSNIEKEEERENIFPFIEQEISNNSTAENDQMVDVLSIYLHVYEYNLRNKKGSERSKEMMYDESAMLSLQLLLDDIVDIEADRVYEQLKEEVTGTGSSNLTED
ncbi:hypothetical protein ACO0OE_002588 [Hanseniaspora uvarum]